MLNPRMSSLCVARFATTTAVLLTAAIASADITIINESWGDRSLPVASGGNDTGNNIGFNTYNTQGLPINGGVTVALQDVIDPTLPAGTGPGQVSKGTKAFRIFALDDNVFTGSGQATQMNIANVASAFLPSESNFEERQFTQWDIANGGTGSFDFEFDYKVTNISFVPGFDGNGTATLPTAIPMTGFSFQVFDPDTNPIIPGNQGAIVTLAAPVGLNTNPVQMAFDNQWHTERLTSLVLPEATRANILGAEANGTIENLITVLRFEVGNIGDLDNDIKIAYELFIDDIRILTESAITGDFNGSGQVEQGDLDLVLQNWGDDTGVTGIPAGWINDNDQLGQIEQTELDRVLQNWGSTSAPDFAGSAVPEPGTLALVGLGGLTMIRRRR